MRALAISELGVVSGGDVLITDRRIDEGLYDPWGAAAAFAYNWESTIDGGGGGGEIQEVVVTAPLMTDQEKLAYDAAKTRAEANLLFVESLGLGVVTWLQAGTSAVLKGILATVGYVPGKIYVGEARADLLERMTELEYAMDGLDGVYDGKVDDDKYRWNL